MSVFTFDIPAGKTATFTAGTAAATLTRLATSPGDTTQYSPVAVAASTAATTLGPFGENRRYQYESDVAGSVAYATPDPDTATAQAALDVRVSALEAQGGIVDSVTAPEAETVEIAEAGNQFNRVTTWTLTAHPIGTAGDDANKAIGALIGTLPAGTLQINNYSVSIALDLDSDVVSDTPDVGIGTDQAEGANPTLSAAGAATENILTGTAAADVDGTPLVAVNGVGPLFIESEDDHTIYLNVADGWADSGSGTLALTATGTVRLFWQWLGD